MHFAEPAKGRRIISRHGGHPHPRRIASRAVDRQRRGKRTSLTDSAVQREVDRAKRKKGPLQLDVSDGLPLGVSIDDLDCRVDVAERSGPVLHLERGPVLRKGKAPAGTEMRGKIRIRGNRA